MAVQKYESAQFVKEGYSKNIEDLTVEEPLQININNNPFIVTMRTPGHDRELVRGILHSEDIIKDASYNPELIFENQNEEGIISVINLRIPEEYLGKGYENSRSLLSVSSCGICGRKEIGDLSFMGKTIDNDDQISIDKIHRAFKEMSIRQSDFQKSGGTHAAAIFDKNGGLLSIFEDIGRHNAVDKAIGNLILNDLYKKGFLMVVSGRVSYEIVVKCFKGRIPILAAVSAPSTLAVDYAKELGITLFGFCRGERATCYAYPQRINTIVKEKKAG